MSKENLTFRNGGFKECIEAKYTIDDMFEAFCAGNIEFDRDGNQEDQTEFAFWLKDYYNTKNTEDSSDEFGDFIENIKNKNKNKDE